jgi:hypothetical protein
MKHCLRHLELSWIRACNFSRFWFLLKASSSYNVIVEELVANSDVVALIFFSHLVALIRSLNAYLGLSRKSVLVSSYRQIGLRSGILMLVFIEIACLGIKVFLAVGPFSKFVW